jgi:hypothetical protein
MELRALHQFRIRQRYADASTEIARDINQAIEIASKDAAA